MTDQTDILANRVRYWFEELWNKGRLEVIDEMLSPDCVSQGLVDESGNPVKGPAGFKPFFTKFRGAFPDIRITVEDTVVQEDKVATRCRVQGTHIGDHLGITATRKNVDFTGMSIVRFKDGMMVEAWNNFNFMGMYQQIGHEMQPVVE